MNNVNSLDRCELIISSFPNSDKARTSYILNPNKLIPVKKLNMSITKINKHKND